jgi:hypothetical protein
MIVAAFNNILMCLLLRFPCHMEESVDFSYVSEVGINCGYIVFIFICRFHTFNGTRPSETVSPGSKIPDEDLYARLPPDTRTPRGWLVDLINR